jgi:hypothetical protein
MPDGIVQTFDPDDLEWYDGNVVDLQLGGLAGGLSRFLISGEVARVVRRSDPSSSAGNIDFARMDYAENGKILVVVLFGGMIEAEASQFKFTEAHS